MSDKIYESPFDLKNEMKRINEKAKTIEDSKSKKQFVEHETAQLRAHAEMLRKMSQFVNSKNKNRQK